MKLGAGHQQNGEKKAPECHNDTVSGYVRGNAPRCKAGALLEIMLDENHGFIVRAFKKPNFGFIMMRKIFSIIRHAVCIARKLPRGQDCSWHWQHILREFGAGRYWR